MRYPLRPLWVIGLTWLVVCLFGAWLTAEGRWIAVAVIGALFLLMLAIPWLRQFRTILLMLAAADRKSVV